MTAELLKEVQALLPSVIDSLPLRILEHRESASFGDAVVVLQAGELRIRVVRERGQVFADFGSASNTSRWFDSAVVLDVMDLSKIGGFHESETRASLSALAAFLRDCGKELMSLFSSERFPTTEQQLDEVQRSRAARQFGV